MTFYTVALVTFFVAIGLFIFGIFTALAGPVAAIAAFVCAGCILFGQGTVYTR